MYRTRTPLPAMTRVDDHSYYLAGICEDSFFLPASAEQAVLERIQRRAAEPQRDDEDRYVYGRWEGIAAATTMADMFEAATIGVEEDDDGNITGLAWAADEGDPEVLALVAPWVREGSYYLLQDDEERYHLGVFQGGELLLYGEAVAENWLEHTRANTDLVLSTLQAAGWTVDERSMRAAHERVASYGAWAHGEYDVERPEAVLDLSGDGPDLELRYAEKALRAWLTLKVWVDFPDKLELTWRPGARLAEILPEIAALATSQPEATREAWRAWARAVEARLDLKVEIKGEDDDDDFEED